MKIENKVDYKTWMLIKKKKKTRMITNDYLSGMDRSCYVGKVVGRVVVFHTVNLIRINGNTQIFEEDVAGTRLHREIHSFGLELEI